MQAFLPGRVGFLQLPTKLVGFWAPSALPVPALAWQPRLGQPQGNGDAEREGNGRLSARVSIPGSPAPPSSRHCPGRSLGPRQQGWEGHTVPEAVAEHVHDLQQRLDTQVPGEIVELEQNKSRFQMGAAGPQQLRKQTQPLPPGAGPGAAGRRTLVLAAAQQPLEWELGQGCPTAGSCPPGVAGGNQATAAETGGWVFSTASPRQRRGA